MCLQRVSEVLDLARHIAEASLGELTDNGRRKVPEVSLPGPDWVPPQLPPRDRAEAPGVLEGRWMSVADAAEWLNVSPSLIRTFIRRGHLPAVRLGHSRGEIRIASPDLWSVMERVVVEPPWVDGPE